MKVVNVPQRSPEWFAARLGRLTSSTASDMLSQPAKGKTESAARRNLRVRLALERVTGQTQERAFQPTAAMQAGIEREADALALYEARSGHLVSRAGFLQHDELMAGASLDAYVGDLESGCFVVECKCPLASTHLETLRTREIDTDYLRQIRHQLWMVPIASHAEFVSFCPEFPDGLQIVTIRVERMAVEMDAHELMARQFLRDVDTTMADILALDQEQIA